MCLLKPAQTILSNEMLFRPALNPLIKAFYWVMKDSFAPLPNTVFNQGLEYLYTSQVLFKCPLSKTFGPSCCKGVLV